MSFITLKDLIKSPIAVEIVITKDGDYGVHCTEMIESTEYTFNRKIIVENGVKGIIL